MTSTGRPAEACAGDVEATAGPAEAQSEFDFHARFLATPPADPNGGTDSETRPAGFVMVVLLVGTWGIIRWVRWRRRT